MYRISSDPNEQLPLTVPPTISEAHYAAYQALVEKDTTLGPASVTGATLYLELPTTPTGPASVPQNAAAVPESILVNGVAANYIGRLNQTDVYDRYWVKCTVPGTLSPPYTSAVVTFSNNPNTGDTRVFNAIQIVAP